MRIGVCNRVLVVVHETSICLSLCFLRLGKIIGRNLIKENDGNWYVKDDVVKERRATKRG